MAALLSLIRVRGMRWKPTRNLSTADTPRLTPLTGARLVYPGGMGKTWVLHTETKGTGAQMVPLESVEKRPSHVEPVFVPRKPANAVEPEPPKPRAPRRFKVVDLMTREELADGALAQEAL